jgi:hypothetical protein
MDRGMQREPNELFAHQEISHITQEDDYHVMPSGLTNHISQATTTEPLTCAFLLALVERLLQLNGNQMERKTTMFSCILALLTGNKKNPAQLPVLI